VNQTILKYNGGTPTITGTVTLFNSVTAMPPGGFLHQLGYRWFQYTIAIGSAAGAGTGLVTGSFSPDKGVTWIPFYTATSADGLAATPAVNEDEVYIGMFKDVRFQYTNAVEVPTVFHVALALDWQKPTSKVTANDLLVNAGLATSA